MATIKLESPMEWVGPYVEMDGKVYRVDAISEDRKTLDVIEMADISPDASPYWKGEVTDA